MYSKATRWTAAVILVTGPLLQAVEFLLENSSADNAVRVVFWAEHPTRIGLSMASGLLAVPFLLGVFITFGMAGLAGAHGYELAAYGLAQSGNLAAATSTLNGDQLGLPGGVFLAMFLGGAALGTLLLAAAVWRSPYVPRIVTGFMLAFAGLDFALGQGVASHLINLVGFALVAFAVVSGYSRQHGKDGSK